MTVRHTWCIKVNMKNRISELRRRAGMSQSDLAERIGTTLSMIGKIERGDRNLNNRWLSDIAAALHCAPADLIGTDSTIPVVGYVGAGAAVLPFDDYPPGDGMDAIERPSFITGRAVAVEVRGDSLLPVAEEGWRLVYTGEQAFLEEEVLNKLCVVQLEDGRVLVKRVTLGTAPQHYHLISTNAPMIPDVRIVWASPVKAIIPR